MKVFLPDGFTAKFYKHFCSFPSPLFIRMTSDFKTTSPVSSSLNTAMITLLFKPNKDYTNLPDCRLLSQINTDIKIINEALASRQDKIILILIHPDQTDVIKGKQLLLINKSHILTLSSHAEKAFAKVNSKLISTNFSSENGLLTWLRHLYTTPTVAFTTSRSTMLPDKDIFSLLCSLHFS